MKFYLIIYNISNILEMGGNKKLEPLMKDAKKMKKLMEESFRKVDIDGNGTLDRAEFEQVLVQIAK